MAGRRRHYVNFPRDSAIWGLLPQSNDVASHNTYSFNGLGPPPAEGVRARRHAATPGRDRAEPFFKLHGEEYISRGVYDHSNAHTHWGVEGSSLSLDVS